MPLCLVAFAGATGIVSGWVERGTPLLCLRAALLSLRTAGSNSLFLAISGARATALPPLFQASVLSSASVSTRTLPMKARTSRVEKIASAMLATDSCFDRRWLGS